MKLLTLLFPLMLLLSTTDIDTPPRKAPAFKLENTKEKYIRLSDFEGKVVLLKFWFVHCGNCVRDINQINRLQDDYKDDLQVLGVEYMNETIYGVKGYERKYGVRYMNLMGGKSVANQYRVFGAPTYVLIDKEGNIVHTGMNYKDIEMRDKIKSLLE